MNRRRSAPSAQGILVDPCGAGEWIVGLPAGERSLHVFRLTATDWLVSEVGRGNEGQGADLPRAIAALAAASVSPPSWWSRVAEALAAAGGPSGE